MSTPALSPATRTIEDYVPPKNRTLVHAQFPWIVRNLNSPDGEGPMRLTREQLRILARWYEIDDRGRFVYRRGTVRRMRGWGKSPFLAVICALEFIGPCRFGGWDADGNPIAVPVRSPWVQLAAVNIEQTRAVMDVFSDLFNDECKAYHGLDIGKELIYRNGPGKLQCVTSSPRAIRGARTTFYCLDETSEWVAATGGHAMMERIRGNLAKSKNGSARLMEICNAYVPGEDSVAEQTHLAWQKTQDGRSRITDIYYDSLEAPPNTDMSDPESLAHGLTCARGDSVWLDVQRFMQEIWDSATSPSMSRRDYLNQITAHEDSLVSAQEWDTIRQDVALEPGDAITLGFDGSKNDDSTALVACRISDRALFLLGIQEKDPLNPDWEVDPEYFDGLVDNAFANYKVVAFYSDIEHWETYVARWADEYRAELKIAATAKSKVGFDMRGNQQRITLATEAFVAGVLDEALTHDGNSTLKEHVLNARRRPNRWGFSFGKEGRESKRKVDALAAAILADMARADLVASGKHADKPRKVMVFR